MTRNVVFATPAETVDDLLTRMTDRRMRHLPVVKDGKLVGIVSIGDLVKCKIAETEAEAESLEAYITPAEARIRLRTCVIGPRPVRHVMRHVTGLSS